MSIDVKRTSYSLEISYVVTFKIFKQAFKIYSLYGNGWINTGAMVLTNISKGAS